MEPLAERLRPRTLDDYIGQEHLVGEGAVLRRMIDSGRIASFYPLGTTRRGQDYVSTDYRQPLRDTVLYAFCRDEWCEGCARCHRKSTERSFLQFRFTDSLYRRNPSFLKVAARFALGCGREGNGDAYWCNDTRTHRLK